MTISVDVVTESAGWSTTPDPFTFSHAGGAFPRGVLVGIGATGDTDVIGAGGVTYGGVAMARRSLGIAQDSAGETCSAYWYWLGKGVPGGTQTVSIDHTATGVTKVAYCITINADGDIEVVTDGRLQGDQADPQIALDAGTKSAMRFFLISSGLNSPSSLTLISGMTALGDATTELESIVVARETSPSTGNTTVGWTAASDDVAMVAIALADRGKTRWYLPSSGAAAVSPSYDGGWEETSDADRLKMVTTKISSAMTNKSATTLSTAGDTLVRQYVGDPLDAQTIDASIRCFARALEAATTVDAVSRIVLKVVSNDGGTVRGTLLSIGDYSTGAEWNTSLRNKSFANGDAPTSVAAQAGDRVVLEIGFNHGAVVSSATINFGDDSGTDLGENETDTAANNPWLEIGQTLTFQSGAASVTLDTASLSATGRVLDVQPGLRSTALDVAAVLTQGRVFDVQPGLRAIPLDVALLAVSGILADVQPGAKSTALDVAQIVVQGRVVDVQNINNIPLDTGLVTALGRIIDIQPGARSIPLDVALLSVLGRVIDIQPGARSIVLDVALLTALGRTISVGGVTVIPLDVSLLSATGRAITVVEGGVSKLLDTALLNTQGRIVDVQQGAVSKLLDTALLMAQGRVLDVQPGARSILLDVSQIIVQGRTITIVEGGVIITLDVAAVAATAPDIIISSGILTIIRTWTLLERSSTWTLESGRGTLTNRNRDREWTVDD